VRGSKLTTSEKILDAIAPDEREGDVWFGDLDEYKWIFTSDLMLA